LQINPNFSSWNKIFNITNTFGKIFIEIAFLIFAYKLFIYGCTYYEQKIQTPYNTFSVILKSLRKSSKLIFILITIDVVISTAAPFAILSIYANNILTISIILSLAWVSIRILQTLESSTYKKIKELTLEKRIQLYSLYTKMRIIRNIGVVIIIIITIAAILMTFSTFRHLGISLLASAGVITAIIGFSGQKTLGSIFAGLQIAFTQPIKIGDTLYIDNKWGIVEEITFTYLYLRMKDKRRMIIPIGYLIGNKFENWTREGNSLTFSIHFKVDYLMPIEPLRDALDKILKKSKYWDGNTKNLFINKLDDASVEVRAQVSTHNAEYFSFFKAELREGFLTFMRENYPQYLPKTRQVDISGENQTHHDK